MGAVLLTCSLTLPEIRHFQLYSQDATEPARWVFFCFQGIHVLTISGDQQRVLNIEERNRTIIDCLGDIYRQIYS